MAIIDSSGIKRDTDASTPLERPSHPSRTPSHSNGGSLPRKNNLSNADQLKNSKDVAKPQGASEEKTNPIKQAKQRNNKPGFFQNRRNRNNNGNGNGEDGTNGENPETQGEGTGNNLDKKDSLLKNPLSKKEDSSTSSDPDKTEGQELGEKVGLRIKNFLKKHPVVILYLLLGFAVIAILYIVISAIIAILSGGAAFELGIEQQKNYGDFFAFDQTEIYLLDENGTAPIGSKTISLSDYIKGIIYIDTKSIDVSRLSEEELIEYYAAIIVSKKAEILKKGNYSNKTKSISMKVTDYNYCDATYGCKLVSKSGRRFYLSNSIEYKVDSVISSIDAMDGGKLAALNSAYTMTVSKIVTPDNVNEPLTEYKWSAPVTNTGTYTSWANNASNGTKYDNLVKGSFPGYKVYNLDDYVTQFESTFLSSYSYWWPIGSKTKDANGLYSDDPETTGIISNYGPSFSTGTINKGIKIGGTCGSTKVISIADGTVSYVGSNNKYGKYVIVNHDDNIRSLYGSLSSTSVSTGSKVEAGTLIGTVGRIKTDDDCALYFEMYKNGVNVNPLDYISADNPRTSKAKYIKFAQGKDNKQTVCKTLLASGFNKNAVAGLMANIERESGFRLDALSDGGTSNGLFQWHKGRLDRLKQYCGAEYLTSIKCQLDYFLYEITEGSEKNDGAYNYLMGNHSAYDMGYQFCLLFERPAGGAVSAATRGNLAQSKYVPYVQNGCQ